jgi:SAM-dependent methyltransferase
MTQDTHWDDLYAASERLFSADPDVDLAELARELTPGRALDVGAGEGRNSIWLARRGWKVVAVDQSRVALERLAALANREGCAVATVRADMLDYLRRGEQFDLVVLANLHPMPEERNELFAAAASAVAPGGYLFVVGHHAASLGKAGPRDPRRLYTEQILRDGLGDLKLVRLERREGVHGDRGEPVTDVLAWAHRPADAAVSP